MTKSFTTCVKLFALLFIFGLSNAASAAEECPRGTSGEGSRTGKANARDARWDSQSSMWGVSTVVQ